MWDDAEGYEQYVGQSSRVVAPAFVASLAAAPHLTWLDVGCGTGALLETIGECAQPRLVAGVDQSIDYLAFARRRQRRRPTTLAVGDADALPFRQLTFDVVVSGLALNFLNADSALAEQCRVAKRGGIVAAYVWDYAGAYQVMRLFWDAAARVDSTAQQHDPGRRFTLCAPARLDELFRRHRLRDVQVGQVDGSIRFDTFDHYWSVLDMRQGSMARYLERVTEATKRRVRTQLAELTPREEDGSVQLGLRAFTVRGRV